MQHKHAASSRYNAPTCRYAQYLRESVYSVASSLWFLFRYLDTLSGAGATGTGLTSIGLLANAGAREVAVLSYAGCFCSWLQSACSHSFTVNGLEMAEAAVVDLFD